MVEISVLLYVFNDDEFIKDSLESIINQSFTDLEIICLDDESTDNSLSLLKQYAQKDNRIKVYSHKHCGLGTSINNVLENVNGKYVQILKAGTLLKDNALSAMFEKIDENEADFVMANIINQDKSGKEYENNQYSLNKVITQCGDKAFGLDDLQEVFLELDSSLENKLYSLQFIQDNDISFRGSCEYSENIFFYETFLSAGKIYCLKDVLFIHQDKYTSLKNRDTKKFLNVPGASNKILDLFKKFDKLENNKKIYNRLFNMNMKGYFSINEIYKNDYFNLIKSALVDLIKSEEIDDFLDNIEDYNRKLFEQILISENSYEFNRLQKTYYEKIEFNKLLNRKKFLRPYIEKMNE